MLIEQGEQIPGDIHGWLEVERHLLELLSYRSWHVYFNDVKRDLVETKVVPTKPGSVFGTGCKEFGFQRQTMWVLSETSLCNVVQLCLCNSSVQRDHLFPRPSGSQKSFPPALLLLLCQSFPCCESTAGYGDIIQHRESATTVGPPQASVMQRTLAHFPSQEWFRVWLTAHTGTPPLHVRTAGEPGALASWPAPLLRWHGCDPYRQPRQTVLPAHGFDHL